MGRKKQYTGYKPYQYLEPGRDYREFKLRKAVIDEWWEPVPLSKQEEERFEDPGGSNASRWQLSRDR